MSFVDELSSFPRGGRVSCHTFMYKYVYMHAYIHTDGQTDRQTDVHLGHVLEGLGHSFANLNSCLLVGLSLGDLLQGHLLVCRQHRVPNDFREIRVAARLPTLTFPAETSSCPPFEAAISQPSLCESRHTYIHTYKNTCIHTLHTYPTLHYTTLHDTTRHDTTVHYTARHDTTPHDTTLHDTTPHCTTLRYTTRQDTTRHDTTLHYTTSHLHAYTCAQLV